jgi:hypothetical protein
MWKIVAVVTRVVMVKWMSVEHVLRCELDLSNLLD